MDIEEKLKLASQTQFIHEFLELIFPEEWYGVRARIIESGATFSHMLCDWAPRWSQIPKTVKTGRTSLEANLKTCLFKVHDCFHQLWGIPVPLHYNEDEFYNFKRAQMCGEVAVVTISEFILGKILYDKHPELRPFLDRRCAIPMLQGPLLGKNPEELIMRIDDILHKKNLPRWLRNHKESKDFADYYIPMLEMDRQIIDHNWKLLKDSKWKFDEDIPTIKYSSDLDGLELTLWMIRDFYHQMKTDKIIDWELAFFNSKRRSKIKFPKGWNNLEYNEKF
jgi:hypothetical protein